MSKKLPIYGLFALLLSSSITLSAESMIITNQPGYIRGEFIYSLENRPTPECHASTIIELKSGNLLAAWFAGKYEKSDDVGIWISTRQNRVWSQPVEVANGIQNRSAQEKSKRYPCWNPVLFRSTNGKILLFYKVGPSPDTWWGMLTTSADEGKTWSTPQKLPEGIIGPIKNKPVLLSNGTILCGASTEDKGWRVHFEWTNDDGITWNKTGPINDGLKIGAIQPSILFHPNGLLQALGRSRQGKIWQAWSSDQGKSWSEMTLGSLPNPNSGTDALTLRDGRHLLVYNHTPKGRSPLNVAVSSDGKAWEMVAVLENEKGEYSYPGVIQSIDGTVHVTYTWQRKTVKHVELNPTLLKLQSFK